MTPSRDKTLDIAKGICILLMVIGHSGCYSYLGRFIYMFHMPCFFFISGYLLKEYYLTDLRTGLRKKVMGTYKPFVKWELIFLLFHNLFAYLYIYRDPYSLEHIGEMAVRICTMTGGETLLGGYWFLISLFWASVGSVLLLSILARYKRLTIAGGGILIGFFTLSAILEKLIPFKIPLQFQQQTMLAFVFYLCGFCYKRFFAQKHPWSAWGMAWLVIPALTAWGCSWSMGNKGWLILPFIPVALAGSLGILSLSYWLSRLRIGLLFDYIGQRTLYILTFHFLAFRMVSFLYIQYAHLPIERLCESPILAGAPAGMWMAYVVTGVGIPLVIYTMKDRYLPAFLSHFQLFKG